MGRGVNKVFLVGNLGQDPDVRTTGAGTQVVSLNIATDESYKDKASGQLVPKTEWHRVVLFGKIAEVAGNYLKKGSKIYIEGKLQTRKWQSKEGVDRYTTEIVVDIAGQMQMLDSPGGNRSKEREEANVPEVFKDENKSERSPESPVRPVERPVKASDTFREPQDQSDYDDFDDDIPF